MVECSFKECSICAAKPGIPTLCESCSHNRRTINNLNEYYLHQTNRTSLYRTKNENLIKNVKDVVNELLKYTEIDFFVYCVLEGLLKKLKELERNK